VRIATLRLAFPAHSVPHRGGGAMQSSLIIESNGSNKEKLDQMLKDGWTVVSITANHGKSYNDFLVILEK